jgi:hypothetical protein
MPDRDVETIRDLILYQYAKIIARSALGAGDSVAAKKEHYGFIKTTFRRLKSGEMSWSDILREDWQLVESEQRCAYCGGEGELHREHIVPRSLRILAKCETCDRIQGIHNQIWACRRCNSLKGTKGLYEFFRDQLPGEKKYYDVIPPLLEKKYLKTIFCCHECAETLGRTDLDGDGKPTVTDIDFILRGPWSTR